MEMKEADAKLASIRSVILNYLVIYLEFEATRSALFTRRSEYRG